MSKQTKKTSERGEKELTAVAAGDEVDGIASAIYYAGPAAADKRPAGVPEVAILRTVRTDGGQVHVDVDSERTGMQTVNLCVSG